MYGIIKYYAWHHQTPYMASTTSMLGIPIYNKVYEHKPPFSQSYGMLNNDFFLLFLHFFCLFVWYFKFFLYLCNRKQENNNLNTIKD